MNKLLGLLFIVICLSTIVPYTKASNSTNTSSNSSATSGNDSANSPSDNDAGEGEGESAMNLVPALALLSIILALVF